MQRGSALVLFYDDYVINSINALAGAIENEGSLDCMDIFLLSKEEEVVGKISEISNKYKHIIVGVSFCTRQLLQTYKLMKALRGKYGRSIFCIAGGPHPTGDHLGALNLGFDVIVVGEGEQSFVELLKKVASDKDYRNVKGVAFLDKSGKYHYSGPRPWVDLNKYPPFAAKRGIFGPIEITRGCPFGCSFCQTTRMLGGKPRHRSVEKICEYAEILQSRGPRDVFGVTPNIFSYGSPDGRKVNIAELERLLKSLRAIVKKGSKLFIGSPVRPEHVSKKTVELIMKYTDEECLAIGGQAGSQRMLDLCHRGHTVKDIYNAVRITREVGLKADVDFIVGLPGEMKKDEKELIAMMKKLAKPGVILRMHGFVPLPQTKFENVKVRSVSKEMTDTIDELSKNGFSPLKWESQHGIARGVELIKKLGDAFRVTGY